MLKFAQQIFYVAEEVGLEPTNGFLSRYGLASHCTAIMRLLHILF